MNRVKHRNVKLTDAEIHTIKIEALREFLKYTQSRGLWARIRFALKIIFRAVPF